MTKVKICGITNLQDALACCKLGADMVGFVFVPGTPRCVEQDAACGMTDVLEKEYPHVIKTGLFRDRDIEEVKGVLGKVRLDLLQLHGLETPAYCGKVKSLSGINIMKVFKVKDHVLSNGSYMPEDYSYADLFVFDTYHPDMAGGTGKAYDWDVIVRMKGRLKKPFMIAGGLTPGNVEEAVKAVKPYGVDVSSGVEVSSGKKDLRKIKEFIENAKKI